MLIECDEYSINLKSKFKKIKEIIYLSMAVCIFLSIVYFFYWIFIISDKTIYEYTMQYFAPLANFLFPRNESFEIYKSTSFALFGFIIPLFFGCVYLDKKEEKLLKAHDDLLEIKKRKQKIQQNIDYLKQFENIKQYSICLSVDYDCVKKIDEKFKDKLNYTIFSKFESYLSRINHDSNLYIKDVLIVTSKDFAGYDSVYEALLNYLAKTKKVTKEKYGLILIPSITTDAFINYPNINNIKKYHFDIKSCNFQNKACSTSLFLKKYNHIQKNKYAGVPIGEYAVFDSNNTKTYELNMVYKNLTDTLTKLQSYA